MACRHIRDHLEEAGLRDFLGPHATLVPMPRSSPVRQNSIWPTRSLVEALVRSGLGRDWQPLLERHTVVKKSATAAPGERPGPEDHYESFRVINITRPSDAITVVDDVVTRGATMLAAVSRLQDAFGGKHVRGFAFVRTTSFEPVTANPVPLITTIRFAGGVLSRDP